MENGYGTMLSMIEVGSNVYLLSRGLQPRGLSRFFVSVL